MKDEMARRLSELKAAALRGKRKALTCPVHQVPLVKSYTRFGYRLDCPKECDVMCWDGPTSTPADQLTRDARKQTHARFDPLWHEHGFSRTKLYKALAVHMGLDQEKTHIGMFEIEQCREAYRFCIAVECGEIEVQHRGKQWKARCARERKKK